MDDLEHDTIEFLAGWAQSIHFTITSHDEPSERPIPSRHFNSQWTGAARTFMLSRAKKAFTVRVFSQWRRKIATAASVPIMTRSNRS
jgi:hypothetical protein